jgi:hypothetical protein
MQLACKPPQIKPKKRTKRQNAKSERKGSEWKGAIKQTGLSRWPFGAAGEANFNFLQATSSSLQRTAK